MFKKILISLVVIALLVGVGYLGYIIFMAKSITNVELVGNIQTLYFTHDDLNFQDASLKVTYKNGESKLIGLDKTDVKVTLFSTETADEVYSHRSMKITYKGFTLEQPYNVIATGLYYVSKKEVETASSSSPSTSNFSMSSTDEMIYFLANGKLMYYHKSGGKWYLEDGRYDSEYFYSSDGDTIVANLGGTKTLNFKAIYDDGGKLSVISVSSKKDGEFLKEKVTSTYQYQTMKNKRVVEKIDVQYSMAGDSGNYHVFHKNDTFETKDIYLRVEYGNDDFLKIVYVKMKEYMDSSNRVSTNSVIGTVSQILWYDGNKFEFKYCVVD